MRTRTPVAAAAPLMLLLVGCTATTAVAPTDPPETYASDTAAPDAATAAIAPGEVEADTTLIVTTTATASNGAQLALEMRVHQPIPFDDVANQTLPGAFIESCGVTYTADLFAAQAWSFARANISAVPTAASTAGWPSAATINVAPAASSVPVIGRGMLREDPAATSPCTEAKSFSSEGNGAIALGVAGDNGAFVGWASQRFGFGAAAGVTFSDCTVNVTAVGRQFGGGDGWTTVSNGSTCTIGAGS